MGHLFHFIEYGAQDLRQAVRALRRTPAFTAIAVLRLALGIGVNAAIFSVVYAVLLRPLPYERPGQLALISSAFDRPGASRAPMPGALLREIQQRANLLSGAAGITATIARLDTAEAPDLIKIARVSSNFFQLLGVRTVRGRTIASGEELTAQHLIVLSNGFWHNRLGGGKGGGRQSGRCNPLRISRYFSCPSSLSNSAFR